MPRQSTVTIPAFTGEDLKEAFALLLQEALSSRLTTKERIARVAGVEPITVTQWISSPTIFPSFVKASRVISYLNGWQRFLTLLHHRDDGLGDNLALAEAALLGARERLAHHPNSQEREAALARLGNLIRIAGEVITQLGGSTVTDMAERRVPRP